MGVYCEFLGKIDDVMENGNQTLNSQKNTHYTHPIAPPAWGSYGMHVGLLSLKNIGEF